MSCAIVSFGFVGDCASYGLWLSEAPASFSFSLKVKERVMKREREWGRERETEGKASKV